MSPERVLRGIPASPGVASGAAWALAPAAAPGAAGDPDAELRCARDALAAAKDELAATASRLRAAGRDDEAAIVDAGTLMAADPALDAAVADSVAGGAGAVAAILAATDLHAGRIAALPDANLAARADDVRSLGRRAARLAAGAPAAAAAPAGAVLVAEDLGPADVAELDDVAAIALAAGGATAHAAIVARSLGIPMVVGLGDAVLSVRAGEPLVVEGTRGELVAVPSAARVLAITPRAQPVADAGPVATRDGHRVVVLANAAGAAEVRAGIAAGAEGIGLLRTELAFLDAAAWPDTAEHRVALARPLGALPPGLPATVRVLDFGGDKCPPFLRGTAARGIALLLAAPAALRAQLDAIVAAGAARVLLPMVESAEQVTAVRALLGDAPVALGAMVETPGAARAARALAAVADFLSIGTNDLAHETLGSDRFATGAAPAHHPAVLRNVAATAAAAAAAGRPLEVCGEAASDPVAMPLLVGLGVGELSVGAARVATVRGWVRSLSLERAEDVAARALTCQGPDDVSALVAAELGGLAEAGDAAGEGGERGVGVGALGAQH